VNHVLQALPEIFISVDGAAPRFLLSPLLIESASYHEMLHRGMKTNYTREA
jgi:hypothetical protein